MHDHDHDPRELFAAIISTLATILLLSLILILTAVCSSCSTTKPRAVAVRATRTDSTAQRVRIIERHTTDTILIHLPPETATATTTDTTSTLRTTHALTTARWDGAHLHHTLATLRTPVPVTVTHTTTTRDSIIHRHTRDTIQVPVPVPHPLTPYQQNAIKYYPRLLLLTLLLTLWAIRRPLLKLWQAVKK